MRTPTSPHRPAYGTSPRRWSRGCWAAWTPSASPGPPAAASSGGASPRPAGCGGPTCAPCRQQRRQRRQRLNPTSTGGAMHFAPLWQVGPLAQARTCAGVACGARALSQSLLPGVACAPAHPVSLCSATLITGSPDVLLRWRSSRVAWRGRPMWLAASAAPGSQRAPPARGPRRQGGAKPARSPQPMRVEAVVQWVLRGQCGGGKGGMSGSEQSSSSEGEAATRNRLWSLPAAPPHEAKGMGS